MLQWKTEMTAPLINSFHYSGSKISLKEKLKITFLTYSRSFLLSLNKTQIPFLTGF